MSNDTILKIVLGAASIAITAIAFVGGLKEGKENFKKLNEHLDEKEKRTKETQVPDHEIQYH